MAPPYKLTIPRTKGELYDLLGWMVLTCPDFTGSLPGRDIEAAFEELRMGLLSVLKPGAKLKMLQAKADKLRKLCDARDVAASIRMLEEMSVLLMRSTTLH